MNELLMKLTQAQECLVNLSKRLDRDCGDPIRAFYDAIDANEMASIIEEIHQVIERLDAADGMSLIVIDSYSSLMKQFADQQMAPGVYDSKITGVDHLDNGKIKLRFESEGRDFEHELDLLEPDTNMCPDCEGRGEVNTSPGMDICERCNGTGEVHE